MIQENHHPADADHEAPGVPRAIAWADLPEKLRHKLSSLPREEWVGVTVTHWQSELMKDADDLVASFARVWEASKVAEDFREEPLSAEERGQFKKAFQKVLQDLAEMTIKLGVRARLYGDIQSRMKLLRFYAPDAWQKFWTKSMARSVSAEGERGAGHGRPNSAHPKSGKPGNASEPARPAAPRKPTATLPAPAPAAAAS